jgi:NADH oxidoreductase Hcr
VKEILTTVDFDMDYFHKESFVLEAKAGETGFSDINHQISVLILNKQLTSNDQKSLLDAMHSGDIKVPYSCKSSICGACMCKVSGDVQRKL